MNKFRIVDYNCLSAFKDRILEIISGLSDSLTHTLKNNEDNIPVSSDSYNFGSAEKRWSNIYAKNIHSLFLDCSHIYERGQPYTYTCKIGNDLDEYKNMMVIGHYNSCNSLNYNAIDSGTSGLAFQIGNGSYGNPGDAFRVFYDGNVDAHGSFRSGNADYAEYLEWKDKNKNNEDRVGKFVTLSYDKIQIANKGDFIAGIISGSPSIIGNHDFDEWTKKYKTDEFGRLLFKDIVTDENISTGRTYVINENYDDSLVYIPRAERPEWDAVGMLGILRVYDDGTCIPDGYCKVADSGIATYAQVTENSFLTPVFKVMKRVSDNIIEIFFK